MSLIVSKMKMKDKCIYSIQLGLKVRFIPDAICGDLDSVRHDVIEFYRSKVILIFTFSSKGIKDN